jgi:hypothetical protein
MSTDLFIYYRVPVAHAATMQKRVTVMQAALQQRWPVTTALKRRPELKEGCETWMEIYGQTPQDFPAALEHAVRDAGLLALTVGERHVETFFDIPTCA